jgi:predicted TIM-barrel fold metal-dependent hydrolase
MFRRSDCLQRHATRIATSSDRTTSIPTFPSGPYTPPDAPLSMFEALHARLGVERAVIVNATPHGRDNRVVTDAIAQSNGRYKGVANVDESFSDQDLD